MSEEKLLLLMIKGTISDLPEADRAKVNDVHTKIKREVEEGGAAGLMAIALLSAEIAVKE